MTDKWAHSQDCPVYPGAGRGRSMCECGASEHETTGYRAAFEAMREALHQTCDRLERSDFPEGGDTERVLNQAYDALALAAQVTR